MKKRTVVISGGSGYLGQAIVRLLNENDFAVIVLEKEPREKETRENISFKFADITDEAAVKKVSEEIREECGEIFAVIHAASAPLTRKGVLDLSREEFEKQFSVNVLGGFLLSKYLSDMISSDGAFIGITSSVVFPEASYPKSGSYTAAKFGLQGLLKSVSAEKKYRVYSVAPAFMPGGLNGDLPNVVREVLMMKMGAGETTNPEDVASAVWKLLEDTKKKWDGKTIAMPGFSVKDLKP